MSSRAPDSARSADPAGNTATPSAQGALRGSLAGGSPLRRPLRLAPVRVCPVGRGLADRLREVWPGLMLRKFQSDAACAHFFGRERQTASNWRNGDCGPDAGACAQAWLSWPDEMLALLTAAPTRGGL